MSLEHSPSRQKAKGGKRKRILSQPTPIDPNAFYNAEQLARRWGVHVMTIWAWARAEKIPRPKKIGPNTSRWGGQTILEHEQEASDV